MNCKRDSRRGANRVSGSDPRGLHHLLFGFEDTEYENQRIGTQLDALTRLTVQLGAEKWGAGPTALALWQKHGWTYGMLANHIWSFAGEGARQDISSTFMQPFVSYQTKTHTTFGVNMESTYDWENEQWTIPLNLFVSQLMKMGKLPVSLQLGGRYYADKPSGGPDWGLRFTMTFAFPK